ncbi:MAG TPA: hypothetical protein VJ385_16330 [Fibrobacteria bacterium]|nr:hypothetical protein [Fibrobacteria bacterium]
MASPGGTPACPVFTRTAGYRPGRIPKGIAAVRKLGRRFRALGLLGLLGLGAAACSPGQEVLGPDAGLPPVKAGLRVYRGGLDGRKGLIFYAAHSAAMTLVYDTARCGLYLAWRGPVDGPLRNPDGSFAPQGPLFHRQEADGLWRVGSVDVTQPARPRFLGFEEDSLGDLILHYALDLPGNGTLRVNERPSYDDHYGDLALRREFLFQGLEAGQAASVRLGGRDFAWKELFSQGANGSLSGSSGEETLTVLDDGLADVKVTFQGSAP